MKQNPKLRGTDAQLRSLTSLNQIEYENLILPFRKPQKSRKNDPVLKDTQTQINQVISSLRVIVEHAFASIKRLKIIRDKIRLKSYDIRDVMMRIATALHNFRLRARKPILNQS